MVMINEFLKSIDNKEVILDTTIEYRYALLLIYPKEPIIVGNNGTEFNSENPFEHNLGFCFDNFTPYIMNDNVMFEVINEVMEHKGFLDYGNQDEIILSKLMLSEIKNITVIITLNDYNDNDYDVSISNVDILDSDNDNNKDIEFIEWINNNHLTIIKMFRINTNTWQKVLNGLNQSDAILYPQSAYELVQVKFEYEETKKLLQQNKKKNLFDVPMVILKSLNQHLDNGIDILNSIVEVDFNNGGNLAMFIESMEKGIPIDFEKVNLTENMIEINFNNSW